MPRVNGRARAGLRTIPAGSVTVVLTAVLAAGALAGCGDDAAGAPDVAWVLPSATPEPSVAPGISSATAAPGISSATPAPSGPPTTGAVPPGATGTAVRFAFPVRVRNVAYHPTHATYPATDIFADCGSPVVAAADGTVLEVSRKDEYVKGKPDGPRNGGLSVSVLGADGARYYGSHLSRITDGIEAGVAVRAGQEIGAVGRTGNANNVCHLHFGISPPCAKVGDWKVRRGVIWPKPYLDSWRRGHARSAAAEAKAWAERRGCRA
jgi:peptidoglycan LD-endopeptidase LytH